MAEEIVNRVANSGLITIDLAECFPKEEQAGFDISSCLYEGLILREKEFRAFVKSTDWNAYQNKHVYLFCSTDAIIPVWAYMLLSSALFGVAKSVFYGTRQEQLKLLLIQGVESFLAKQELNDARVVVKGCADLPIGPEAYVALQTYLQGCAKAIMFGEACSTVPIYKKPRLKQ